MARTLDFPSCNTSSNLVRVTKYKHASFDYWLGRHVFNLKKWVRFPYEVAYQDINLYVVISISNNILYIMKPIILIVVVV